MGKILKAAAFLFGLSLLGYGIWLFALPLLLYAFSGFIFGRKKRSDNPGVPQKTRERFLSKRQALGVFFIILAGLGLADGGRLSVFLFGTAGLLVLLWGRLPIRLPGAAHRPVTDSVLLRSSIIPFSWTSIAEVKLLTRNVAGVLSSIAEPVMIISKPKPAIYVVVRTSALTYGQAIAKVTDTLRGIASVLLPVGGYVAPLDSAEASGVLGSPLVKVRGSQKEWKDLLHTAPYDLVVISPNRGFVDSIGLYRKGGEGAKGSGSVPHAFLRIPKGPLVWELIKTLEKRVAWSDPDELTDYLASFGASSGEPLAGRISGAMGSSTVVTELAGHKMELEPTRLRMLAKIYG